MAYVPTIWAETGMTTQNKVDGLNNLETIYSSAVSAIDAIDHSDRYYTKAQADTKYFTAATDGAGQGIYVYFLMGVILCLLQSIMCANSNFIRGRKI